MVDHFLFCGFELSGIAVKIGDTPAYYKVNLQSLKRFLRERGNLVKIVSITEEVAQFSLPAYFLLRKLVQIRHIEHLIYYPNEEEIHFAFKKNSSDVLKIVKI